MNRTTKLLIGITFLNLSFLAGCSSNQSVEVDNIIDENGAFSFNLNETPLLTFSEDGMKVLNSESVSDQVGEYPLPFEPEKLYDDYKITHSEDLLRIESNDLTYELAIIGPRLFRDEGRDLELNTTEYLLDESSESN